MCVCVCVCVRVFHVTSSLLLFCCTILTIANCLQKKLEKIYTAVGRSQQ